MTCARCRLREACDWRSMLCVECLRAAVRMLDRTDTAREPKPGLTRTSPWVRNAQTSTLPAKEYAR